ncbi:TOBE domain-containing protein [Methylocapsa aurea]|uniref:TOBE domain-containing protein n=1 Tax=Methylocapsa aurea TaxID=663610 RepID=UPI0009FFB4B4|nr:TOBE domain-containing protein [Methylocapsa aurea]
MPRTLPGKIDTLLALRADGRLLVGRERVTLLEAVIQHGSITKAAEIAGFSYKTAWDAVNAINNLLPRPAFITHTGGPRGGGAEVTDEGRRLIATFRRLEEKLGRISDSIVEVGLEHEEDLLFWGIGLKLSVRNAFHCTIVEIIPAPVNVEVKLKVSSEIEIIAVVTNASIAELGLTPGRSAVAMVNASSVMLAPRAEAPRISARNKIAGIVLDRVDGGVVTEVTLDIGEGKTITSVITHEGADGVEIAPGAKVWAIFKSSNVILASD